MYTTNAIDMVDAIRECEGRDNSAELAPWDGVAEHDKVANVGRRHCDFPLQGRSSVEGRGISACRSRALMLMLRCLVQNSALARSMFLRHLCWYVAPY
jgi:hypothetical protein